MTDERRPGAAEPGPSEAAITPDVRPGVLRPQRQGTAPRDPVLPRDSVPARSRPDTRPARVAFGVGSVAALSALATAIVAPPPPATTAVVVAVPPDALPSPSHIVRYVQLKPGQTAPPQAVVRQPATPKPRIVTIVTRQSGVK